MKKKIVALTLIASMVIGACACGNADSADSTKTDVTSAAAEAENAPEEGTQAIEVDDGLIMTEVTFSSFIMQNDEGEPMTQEEADEWVKGSGFTSATVNEDGSVTVKMTKMQKEQALKNYKEAIDADIQKFTAGSGAEESVESFMAIEYSDDLSEVNISVDSTKYTDWDIFNALAFVMYGAYYQMLDGKTVEELNTTVYFIDQDTEEVLETYGIQDLLGAGEGTDETAATGNVTEEITFYTYDGETEITLSLDPENDKQGTFEYCMYSETETTSYSRDDFGTYELSSTGEYILYGENERLSEGTTFTVDDSSYPATLYLIEGSDIYELTDLEWIQNNAG